MPVVSGEAPVVPPPDRAYAMRRHENRAESPQGVLGEASKERQVRSPLEAVEREARGRRQNGEQ